MKRSEYELKEDELFYKVKNCSGRWIGYRTCPSCKNDIKYEAGKRGLLLRNIRNNKEKKCNSCNKKGENNHFFGKKHSNESKKMNSENRKGKACGQNNAMANPIYRQKASTNLKAKYDSGDLDFLKKIQSNTAKKNQELGLLKYAPISKPEKEIKKKLEAEGFTTESQFPIKSLHYDLFIKEKNLLVEYNGDYWHCNPKKYPQNYFNKKKNMTAEQLWIQDKKKKSIAIENGYGFLTIWEGDYKKNKEIEINKILNYEK